MQVDLAFIFPFRQQQNTQLPPRPLTSVSGSIKPESPVNLSKSDILLGAILRTCERNRHLEDSNPHQLSNGLKGRRLRTESENLGQNCNHLLDPLDLSFDNSKEWSEDDEEVGITLSPKFCRTWHILNLQPCP